MSRCSLSLIALFALLPAASAAVELRSVQACYGRYGPTRTKLEVVAQEELMFRFTIVGLKTAGDGRTDATLSLTLADATGKELLSETRPIQARLPFGESTTEYAALTVNPTAAPGEYLLQVKVDDKLAAGSARFVRKITVKPSAFAVVNPRPFLDKTRALPGPCGGFAGQMLYLRVQAASPQRVDGKTAVAMRLQVFDLEGNEVLQPALTMRREAADDQVYQTLSLEGELPLGRSGEFVLKITLTDEATGREAVQELALTIHQP